MTKYKYTRKEWLDYFNNLDGCHITVEAQEALLATIPEDKPKYNPMGDYNPVEEFDKVVKSIRPEKEDKETLENKRFLIKHGYSKEQVDRMDILQLTELALELDEELEITPTPSPIEEIKLNTDRSYSFAPDHKKIQDKINEIITHLNNK